MYPFLSLFGAFAISHAIRLDGMNQVPLSGQMSTASPPLTYIPPIGLGTWLSKPDEVCQLSSF